MEVNNLKISNKIIEILLIIFPIVLLFSNIISELIILTLIVFYLSISKINKVLESLKDPIILLLLLFWLYIILNYIINFQNNPDLERTIFFIRFPLLILSISFFINTLKLNLKKIFLFWLIFLLIICADLFLQKFTLTNIIGYKAIPQGDIYRLGGFMDQELKISNFIFHFGSITLAFFISSNLFSNTRHTLINLLFLLLLIVTIFITAERSNFITIISFAFLLLIFLSFKNIKLSLSFLGILLILFVLTFEKNKDNLSLRMTSQIIQNFKLLKYEPGKSYFNKNSHYFTHASVAYQIFEQNKLFGVGIKNFRNFCDNDNFNKDIHPSWQKVKCSTHPHNFYFEILSELGMLGLLLLIIFFLFSFINVFKVYLKTKNNFILINLFIILVYFIPFLPRGSFFTNWNAIIFWTIFGFMYATYKKPQKK